MAYITRHGNRILVRFCINGRRHRTTLHLDVDRETAEDMAVRAESWLRGTERGQKIYATTASIKQTAEH